MQNNFIPFGAQYYRYPTPYSDTWEKDLQKFKACGFNTIKIWAQWRSNNPREGVYDFSDLRQIMDIAHGLNLKVIINIILDVAPAWFFQKYPESVMVMENGLLMYPRACEYRQIGGAPGPCYHHPEANQIKREFCEKLSAELGDHPALYMWDLWNEPELTTGFAREADLHTMVCYCDHSRTSFIQWLKEKYGTIAALNLSWSRNYNHFDEVELPHHEATYIDMIDWRTFFADSLVEDLKLRIGAVKKFDSIHPVMVHTVPPPYFNMLNSCCDDYKMAKECDLFGNSIASSPFPVAYNVSCANGKAVLNSEIHAVGGNTFNRPHVASLNEFKRHIFTPLARGIKGFLFWQFKPEIVGRESPAWGLTDIDGGDTHYLRHATYLNNILQKHKSVVAGAVTEKTQIAIVKDNNNEILTYCATLSTDKYFDTLFGAFDAFYDMGYNADVITNDFVADNDLSQYKVIYYPLPYILSGKVSSKLKQWIADGGMLISEAIFGGYDLDLGRHGAVPGFGFDAVFGATEQITTTASDFVAAYGDSWAIENQDADIVTLQYGDEIIHGYYFCEELMPQGATVLARFGNDSAAITVNEYGNGKAVFVGTLLGAGYKRRKTPGTKKLLNSLLEQAGVKPFVTSGDERVRADVLHSQEGSVLILFNNSGDDVTSTIAFDCKIKATAVVDTDIDANVEFTQKETAVQFQAKLCSGESKLYIIK